MEARVLLDAEVVEPLLARVGQVVPQVYASFIEVALSWPTEHLHLTPRDEAAVSQNRRDEAITVGLSRRPGPFSSTGDTAVTLENATLGAVWVAETVLHFSDEVRSAFGQRAAARARYFGHALRWHLRGRPREDALKLKVEEVTSGAVAGHAELVAHPDRRDELRRRGRPLNRVQAGVVLEFDRGLLPAFSDRNGFNFPLGNGKGLRDWPRLRAEFGGAYRFVPLDRGWRERAFG